MQKDMPQSKTPSAVRTYPCPNCQRPTQWQANSYKPFCSERCKLIDLGAWANEDYKLPVQGDIYSE